MSDYRQCVLCSKPREADVGLLCNHHIQHFADMLREVEDEAALLDAVPSMQVRPGRGASLASHRSPAVLNAIVATDRRRGTGHIGSDHEDPWAMDDTASILDTLGSWAQVVRDERGLVATAPSTVSGERDTLSRHLTWICAQPWVDECYHDVRRLLGQLRATNGTQPDKPVGRCPDLLTGSDCGGNVWLDQAAGHAHCERCARTWDGVELHRLGIILEDQRREDARPRTEDGRLMKTAHEIAAELGVTVNTVRVRLTRVGAKSIDGHFDSAVLQKVAA